MSQFDEIKTLREIANHWRNLADTRAEDIKRLRARVEEAQATAHAANVRADNAERREKQIKEQLAQVESDLEEVCAQHRLADDEARSANNLCMSQALIIKELRAELAALQDTCTRTLHINMEQSMMDTRKTKAELEAEVARLRAELIDIREVHCFRVAMALGTIYDRTGLSAFSANADSMVLNANNLKVEIQDLQTKLANANRERDEALLAADKLRADLDTATAAVDLSIHMRMDDAERYNLDVDELGKRYNELLAEVTKLQYILPSEKEFQALRWLVATVHAPHSLGPTDTDTHTAQGWLARFQAIKLAATI